MATRLDPALNPDIFGMQPQMLRGPSLQRQTPMQSAESRLQTVESDIEKNLKQQAEFAGQEAMQRQTMAQTEAAGKAEILRERADVLRQAEAPVRAAEEERMKARFEPTRENATEMAAMYSLIGVLGFAIGRGGKQSAMNAMSAMNGMLEGYRQGSTDRYNAEKKMFDTNLKQLTDNINTLTNQLQRVTQLSTIDKAAAEQELAVTLAQSGADFVRENINKFGLPATLKYLQQVQAGAQRAVQKERDAELKAEQKAKDAEEARRREQERRDFQRAMQTERLTAQRDLFAAKLAYATAKADAKAQTIQDKPPPKEITAQNQLRNNIIPRLEKAIPVLDRLNKEGKWPILTTALAADPRFAESIFSSDKEALDLILTLAYFRSKEFETAGKALTRMEDKILSPIVRGDLRVYEGIRNAMEQGLDTAKKEQKGLETTYPFLKKYNSALRGELGSEGSADIEKERADAKAAIASGKDETAVRNLFKQRTGQDL